MFGLDSSTLFTISASIPFSLKLLAVPSHRCFHIGLRKYRKR
ncbi:hypothetical protein BN178_840001 [Clostridioides difficile T42]|nr:hypothetical protein BN178_840001 [Clostridioides difficile T42]